MEIHAELLIGKKVFDRDGQYVGRLEELRADDRAEAAYVTHFLVGAYAVFERLAAWRIGRAIAGSIGSKKALTSYAIPWQKMDLSDPAHPRITCSRSELAPFEL